MNAEELRTLIDDALEGDISEADFLRLEAELSVDPVARREYYDRVLLSTLLEGVASQGSNLDPPPISDHRESSQRWRWAIATMAVICASLLLVIAFQWQMYSSTNRSPVVNASGEFSPNEEQQSSGFAILSGQADAIWEDVSLVTGEVVPPGELQLESGLAQFELFSGVTLVFEGAAKFSILSPMEVSVVSGKVRARVPEPAQGFRLLTNEGEVVDLGTEFAVNVSSAQSEVHVLDGEVDWHPNGLPSQRLSQGDATRINRQGQTAIKADPGTFIGTLDFERRIQQQQKSRRDKWDKAGEQLAQDERLIARYQLIASPERRLPNLASRSAQPASEGAVVAAAPAQNRWGETAGALDFSPAGSRVRLQVPGEYQNLTLICSVRINSLDRWYNSLFLTDGHDQGEPHWQIMDDGRLFFSVKKRDDFDRSKGEMDKHVFYSPPFWTPSLSGRWLMIATVYDGQAKQVTHYLNGDVLSQEAIPDEYLVTSIHIGDASLCNWGLPERHQPKFAIRNLNGNMDEFLMFAAPLKPDEIRQLYEVSRP